MLFSNRATEFPLPEPAEVPVNSTLFFIILAALALFLLVFLIKDYFSFNARALEPNPIKRVWAPAVVGVVMLTVFALLVSSFLKVDARAQENSLNQKAFTTAITNDYGVEVRYIADYYAEDRVLFEASEYVPLTVLDNGNKYGCEALIFEEGTYAVYCGENTTKVALETLVD